MSIFQAVIANKIPYTSHFSDLYIPVNEVTSKLISDAKKIQPVSFSRFIDQITGEPCYDVAFAYDPYWEKFKKK